MIVAAPEELIEIRVERVSQLFNMLDPFPFRERDLSPDAEEFIVGWARELPAHRPIRIVVHLPPDALSSLEAQGLGDAFSHYFAYRAEVMASDLREMFRVGRLSMGIGAVALAACLVASQIVSSLLGPSTVRSFVTEGLIILGWVANWRPMEIFIYDWWPLARRRRLYERLAAAEVMVEGPRARPKGAPAGAAAADRDEARAPASKELRTSPPGGVATPSRRKISE